MKDITEEYNCACCTAKVVGTSTTLPDGWGWVLVWGAPQYACPNCKDNELPGGTVLDSPLRTSRSLRRPRLSTVDYHDKKAAQFDVLAFKAYGRCSNYPLVLHRLRQCLKAIATFTPGFSQIGIKRRFHLAQSAYIVALHTADMTTRNFRLSLPPWEGNEPVYALDWGYQEPKTVAALPAQPLAIDKNNP
jgi:hypothetical protein